MSDVTIEQLAKVVGTPIEKLLSQLEDAGVGKKKATDTIDTKEKSLLLAYLRKSHGKEKKPISASGKKLSLGNKKTVSSTTLSRSSRGKVNIAIKGKKRTLKRPLEKQQGSAEKPAEKTVQQAKNKKDEIAEKRSRKEAELRAFEEKRRKAMEEINAKKERQKKASKKEENKPEVTAKEKPAEKKAGKKKEPARERTFDKVETAADVEALLTANKTKKKKKKLIRNDDDFKNKIYTAEDEEIADAVLGRRRKKHVKKELKVENKHGFEKPVAPSKKMVEVYDQNKITQLAQAMSVKAAVVIKELFKMGVMATINESIDRDTATLLVEELGHEVKAATETQIEDDIHHIVNVQHRGEKTPRPPVVTVMGHVDHGKTSLLDYIRKTRVTSGEAGGITQHIGSYHVETDHGDITFLDTPGHAAFTAMRARGAKVTDIVILVVAADDGVMPQTVEAIQHAQAAEVPIIVAVNKIDKEGANPEKVKKELTNHNIIPEDWGGDSIFVEVSAKEGTGIDDLLEAISLQADLMELKAYAEGFANGIVIESRLEKGRGTVASLLIQNGILNQGDIVLVGTEYGRVRAMMDENGKKIKSAGPSMPVEVLGLSGTPSAGDDFVVMESDRKAREAAEERKERLKMAASDARKAVSMEDFFARADDSKMKTLNIVLKADVQGSFEAIRDSLSKIVTDEVKVNVIGGGVGGIRETDVTLAQASNAIIIGFNVRADNQSKRMIQEAKLDLKYYSIIYNLLDDVKDAVSGMLTPEVREEIIGIAEVRDVFYSPKFGAIAGCMVVEGKVRMSAPIRVLREDVVIYEGELESLRRFKEQVDEVRAGTECGIGVKNYNDVKAGDKIEVFERTEVKRKVEIAE